ncbi:MAG: Putative stomatin/prohibitin-family membrane protease subunit YbbK [uncultured Sulfurovum sp.]|uniref:Stomatin/prohibitin-family membrane protease subunit YbbK n=1 Tax=uncultured Sulfurovum sp. TaxID=269237 RepID=A0A6S6SYH5_9BACT|nr:MAG: Putative stomatin/prohibitin-family membrane protease subunit YbbK [uncultured Sulfurovum sp.]
MESILWFILVFILIAIPMLYLFYPYLTKTKLAFTEQDIHDDYHNMDADCSKLGKKKLSFSQKMAKSFDSFIVTIGLGRLFLLRVVPSEEAWVIDRHGVDRVACEGINRIIPSLDKIEAKVDLREVKVDPAPQTILTKDNINITVDMFSMIKVIHPLKAIKEVEDYQGRMENLVMTSTFTALARRNFSEIQQNSEAILGEIREIVEKDSSRWGIKLTQISFEDITSPQDILDAEQQKIVAEKESDAKLTKANAEFKEQELRADSERIRIEKRAEATHKAIKDLQKLMPNISDERIMQFLTSASYIDSMKELSSSGNSKFVLYPSDVHQPMDKVMSAEYLSQTINKNK